MSYATPGIILGLLMKIINSDNAAEATGVTPTEENVICTGFKKGIYKAHHISAGASSPKKGQFESFSLKLEMGCNLKFEIKDEAQNFIVRVGFSPDVFAKEENISNIKFFENCKNRSSTNYGDTMIALSGDNKFAIFDRRSGKMILNDTIEADEKSQIKDLAQDLNGDLVVTTTLGTEYRYNQNKSYTKHQCKSSIALADLFSSSVNDPTAICKVVPFAKEYYAVFLENFKSFRIYDKNINFVRSVILDVGFYDKKFNIKKTPASIPTRAVDISVDDIAVLSNGDLVLLNREIEKTFIIIIRDANTVQNLIKVREPIPEDNPPEISGETKGNKYNLKENCQIQ